jgi:hypothetical protein
MHRTRLTEAFHGEGDGGGPVGDGFVARDEDMLMGVANGLLAGDSLTSRGNEMLTVAVNGGKLTILTRTDETDEDAIRHSRFVSGELEIEDGKIYHFWLSDEGRGAINETAVYKAGTPQTG